MKRKRGRGRPRGFYNRDIIHYTDRLYVVVDHRMRGAKSEYRLIPITPGHRRAGAAIWAQSYKMTNTGRKSGTGTVLTYRANTFLEEELPEGRGCKCQCCIHEAQPRRSLSRWTGDLKDDE